MLDSLFSRRTRSWETDREDRLQRARGAAGRRPESMRGTIPEATTLLQTLLTSRNLLVAIKDLDGRYLEVNEAYARALGLDVDAIRGRLDRDLLPPDVAGELAQRERLAMRGVVLKPELESFDRESSAYLVERLPVRDGRGDLKAVFMVAMGSQTEATESAPVTAQPAIAAAVAAPPPPAEDPTVPAAGEIWLSEAARSTQLDWDSALYRSLLSHFCQRYEGFSSRVAARLEAGKPDGLARELSQLSRGARSLGAVPLANLALGLLGVLQQGGGEGLEARLPELQRVLGATVLVMECRILATSDALEWPMAAGAEESSVPTDVLSAA
ncbi:MAG: PAS domain-containing protein [Thermoanaerobaculia bacterium]